MEEKKVETQDTTILKFIKLYKLNSEAVDPKLYDMVFDYYLSNQHFEYEENLLLKMIKDLANRILNNQDMED